MDMLERGFVAMAAICLVILVGLTTLLTLSLGAGEGFTDAVGIPSVARIGAGGLGHTARPGEPRR